jgi:hypothetical protein
VGVATPGVIDGSPLGPATFTQPATIAAATRAMSGDLNIGKIPPAPMLLNRVGALHA